MYILLKKKNFITVMNQDHKQQLQDIMNEDDIFQKENVELILSTILSSSSSEYDEEEKKESEKHETDLCSSSPALAFLQSKNGSQSNSCGRFSRSMSFDDNSNRSTVSFGKHRINAEYFSNKATCNQNNKNNKKGSPENDSEPNMLMETTLEQLQQELGKTKGYYSTEHALRKKQEKCIKKLTHQLKLRVDELDVRREQVIKVWCESVFFLYQGTSIISLTNHEFVLFYISFVRIAC